MDFTRIETLDDVTPYVSFEKGFVVSRRSDHTIVDYVYTVEDTFETAVALECRGLKFDREGRIIGRPFHKFFNLGERERVEDIDWSQPHMVLAKLDGSMIHPVMLNGDMVFMTRKGGTAQAMAAQGHADVGVLQLCRQMLDARITPIFEFTAPDNRIVVAYERPELTLLAAREIVSGAYVPHAELSQLAAQFSVPVVAGHDSVSDAKGFVDTVRRETGIEGYVVAFADGHRLKLKTDGYVLRHKALTSIQFEKNVLAWVAKGAVDDVVPILSDELGRQVRAYEASVHRGINRQADEVNSFVDAHRDLQRRDFATAAFKALDKRLTFAAFMALDGKDTRTALMSMVEAASYSDARVDAVRDLFGMTWSVEGLPLPDLEA